MGFLRVVREATGEILYDSRDEDSELKEGCFDKRTGEEKFNRRFKGEDECDTCGAFIGRCSCASR